MSPCLSANIAKVAAMYDLTFRKSKGLEEDDDEEDEEDEDEKVEESSDSDSESNDAKDEGPTTEDEGPTAGDKGLAAGDEGPDIRVESLGLGGDEAVPEGQHRVASVMETVVGKPPGLGYGALRRREIASREGQIPYVFEVVEVLDPYQSLRDQREQRIDADRPRSTTVHTPPSPEWSSGSLPISPEPSIVPSLISSPMISLTVLSPVASPATAEAIGSL
nr:hypothetical protein [Tanacetum cinerariifolium]